MTAFPSAASARWRSRRMARSGWWRATDETTRSISTVRISFVTSRPSIQIEPTSTVTGCSEARAVSAASSSRSSPRSSASHVSARYIAPVST